MKKTIYRFIQEQKDDWVEFTQIVGLKNTIQQMAVGAALCLILLAIIGVGDWIAHLISGC